MSRYIDVSNLDIPSDENDYDELVAFADKVAEMITGAPSIDIVRCNECKYYIDFIGEQFINAPTLCGRLSTLDNYVVVKADDFCSYGQKGDENVETD